MPTNTQNISPHTIHDYISQNAVNADIYDWFQNSYERDLDDDVLYYIFHKAYKWYEKIEENPSYYIVNTILLDLNRGICYSEQIMYEVMIVLYVLISIRNEKAFEEIAIELYKNIIISKPFVSDYGIYSIIDKHRESIDYESNRNTRNVKGDLKELVKIVKKQNEEILRLKDMLEASQEEKQPTSGASTYQQVIFIDSLLHKVLGDKYKNLTEKSKYEVISWLIHKNIQNVKEALYYNSANPKKSRSKIEKDKEIIEEKAKDIFTLLDISKSSHFL